MSRFNWLTIFALGLAILAPTNGVTQDNEPHPEAEHSQPTEQEIPIPFPVRIVESEADANSRESIDEETRQRDIDDLVAQQGMDESTREMTVQVRRQTWIVGAGTLLVLISLGLMWQANRAAVTAVEVTRNIGEAQTRAYVATVVESLPQKICIKNVSQGRYNIKNTGITPAIGATIQAGLMPIIEDDNYGKDVDDPSSLFTKLCDRDIPSKAILSAGADLSTNLDNPPLKGYETIEETLKTLGWDTNKPHKVVLIQRIQYEDVFGAAHETVECFIGVPKGDSLDNGGCYTVLWGAHHSLQKMT